MSLHKCWSLYNKEEKLRIDDLRIDQVRTILLAIPTAKISEWCACREGDLHWQSLADVPDFYEDALVEKGRQAPAPARTEKARSSAVKPQPARRPLFEDGVPDADTTLQVESAPTKERRTARRYVRNLNFKISSPPFECATTDISMNGISLKEPLPAEAPKRFRAELSLNGTNLKIHVYKISDTTLRIEDADAWDVLRNWIVTW
jgi:hypothetical protein